MTGTEALAILALPGAKGRGGALQNATSITPWQGRRVRLSARLASVNVERLHLWLRVLGPERQTQMRRYDMSDAPIRGTTDWRRYEIVMDVPRDASFLSFGVYIEGGRGKAFADAVTLEEVGAEVPALQLSGIASDGWQVRDDTLWAQAARAQAASAAQAIPARRRDAEMAIRQLKQDAQRHRQLMLRDRALNPPRY
jgi:hypothetical protein